MLFSWNRLSRGLQILLIRGAPDSEFWNPAGTGFAGIHSQIRLDYPAGTGFGHLIGLKGKEFWAVSNMIIAKKVHYQEEFIIQLCADMVEMKLE